jgi:hypothetical protein
MTSYKWVPDEPTNEMLGAFSDTYLVLSGHDVSKSYRIDLFREAYSAMLNAAPEVEQEVSRTHGMTLKQRIEHVGGTIAKDYSVVFGTIMAVNALIGHVIRNMPPEPGPEPLTAEQIMMLWDKGFDSENELVLVQFARAIEKAHGIVVEDAMLIPHSTSTSEEPTVTNTHYPCGQSPQEPVLYQSRMRMLPDGLFGTWDNVRKETYEDHLRVPINNGWGYETRALCICQNT